MSDALTPEQLASLRADPYSATAAEIRTLLDDRAAALAAQNTGLRAEYDDLMEDVKRSLMKHGDCKSGKRYGGIPKACTACMAVIRLKERAEQWKGRVVRIAAALAENPATHEAAP